MNRGTKVFLGLAAAGVTVGGIIMLTAKQASAAPALPKPAEPEPVVVVPEGDGEPALVPAPSSVNIPEVNRLLLRWWSAEGAAFPASELPAGTPRDFGSETGDLSGTFGPRSAAVALAFCQGNCTTAVLNGLRQAGIATPELLTALERWASSAELPDAAPAASDSEPAPIVIQDQGGEPVVLAPSAPPVPLPPSLPLPVAPPPFVPQAPPQSAPTTPVGPPPFVAPPPPPPAPVALPEPIPPAPVVVAPPAASLPSLVPADTAAMVAALLTDEASASWKKKSAEVQAWQKSRGLKQDGQFGPKSALTVAGEIGTVPIVRYWPTGAQQSKAVRDYQAALLELANAAPEPRASQLRVSAQREQGQGFGSKQTALPPGQRVQLAQVA